MRVFNAGQGKNRPRNKMVRSSKAVGFMKRMKKIGERQQATLLTLAMLPELRIPRHEVQFNNSDGTLGSSEVLLAADVVFD